MPFSITFVTNDSKVVSVPEKANLLRTSIREKGGIPFKCGAGICGTCKCKIEKGLENTDAIKDRERNHLTEADFAAGHRMACQTFVHGDIAVSWVPLALRPPLKPRLPLKHTAFSRTNVWWRGWVKRKEAEPHDGELSVLELLEHVRGLTSMRA